MRNNKSKFETLKALLIDAARTDDGKLIIIKRDENEWAVKSETKLEAIKVYKRKTSAMKFVKNEIKNGNYSKAVVRNNQSGRFEEVLN